MSKYIESNLQFDFPDDCVVIKYDDTEFHRRKFSGFMSSIKCSHGVVCAYKAECEFSKECPAGNRSGGGTSAVDFVVYRREKSHVNRDDILWLIEVKDCLRSSGASVYQYAYSLPHKVLGTLAGLMAGAMRDELSIDGRGLLCDLSGRRILIVAHFELPWSQPSGLWQDTRTIAINIRQKMFSLLKQIVKDQNDVILMNTQYVLPRRETPWRVSPAR